ncbi:MAG: hypothetical protein QOG43_540, partial [Actinomycetota bacterium]|nr:hypothetical protein [Actinomycetota bacterium]
MSACVRTLPIRLEPLPGESLDGWLFAYAARLDTPLTEFAATTGLPRGFVRQTPRSIALGKSLNSCAGIARAAGMGGDSVDRLWRPFARYAKAVRSRFDPPGMLRPVVPMGWSRFCPACLSACGDRWKVAWRLVWHTTCDVHGCLLIDACPVCDRHQREHPFVTSDVTLRPPCACSTRSAIGTGRLGQACGHDLTSAPAPTDADVGRRTLAFQAAVAPALGADAGAAARRQALDVLADVLLIAAGLGGDAPLGVQPLAKPADVAQVLARAWDCYVGDAEGDMVRVVTGDMQIPGVLPRAWSVASQSLTARAIVARDGSMSLTDRLRWRSMTTPGRPTSRGLEVARRRGRYLPEALWADWAVRLTPATGVDAKSFRVVAAAALLLPGTPRPLETVLRGTPHEGRGRKVFHVLAMVAPTDATAVLRALTEIADGLDSLGGVIDYQRRR